eukprot:COSAG01_NODE_1254_length_11042_cov_37.493192_8_plen_390_part_00
MNSARLQPAPGRVTACAEGLENLQLLYHSTAGVNRPRWGSTRAMARRPPYQALPSGNDADDTPVDSVGRHSSAQDETSSLIEGQHHSDEHDRPEGSSGPEWARVVDLRVVGESGGSGPEPEPEESATSGRRRLSGCYAAASRLCPAASQQEEKSPEAPSPEPGSTGDRSSSSCPGTENAEDRSRGNADWLRENSGWALDPKKLTEGLKRVYSMPGRKACAAWLNSAGIECDASVFSLVQEDTQGLDDVVALMDAYKEALEDFLEENKEGEDEEEEGAAKELEELVELAEILTEGNEALADELAEELADTDLVFMMKEELKLEGEDQQKLLQRLEAVVAPYNEVAKEEKHRRDMHQLFFDGDKPKLLETLRAMSKARDASMATSRCDGGA